MNALQVTGIGAGFVACIVAGFLVGLRLAAITGQAWWPIAGLFTGLLGGGIAAAAALRQALK